MQQCANPSQDMQSQQGEMGSAQQDWPRLKQHFATLEPETAHHSGQLAATQPMLQGATATAQQVHRVFFWLVRHTPSQKAVCSTFLLVSICMLLVSGKDPSSCFADSALCQTSLLAWF